MNWNQNLQVIDNRVIKNTMPKAFANKIQSNLLVLLFKDPGKVKIVLEILWRGPYGKLTG